MEESLSKNVRVCAHVHPHILQSTDSQGTITSAHSKWKWPHNPSHIHSLLLPAFSSALTSSCSHLLPTRLSSSGWVLLPLPLWKAAGSTTDRDRTIVRTQCYHFVLSWGGREATYTVTPLSREGGSVWCLQATLSICELVIATTRLCEYVVGSTSWVKKVGNSRSTWNYTDFLIRVKWKERTSI